MKLPRRATAIVLVVLAVTLVAVGRTRKERVYELGTDEFGLQTFIRVSGPQLVEDATFGGVIRKDGKLYSAYNRLGTAGKRACPT